MSTMVRRGLVLGAGGALGAAWTVGALSALAEIEGYDPGQADLVVGTSAGSVIAALLGCGVPLTELTERLESSRPQLEGTAPVNAFDVHSALAAIPRPTLLPGNLRLAARAVGRPTQHTFMTLAAGLAPRGHGDLIPLADLIAETQGEQDWPDRPPTWIVAMDFDSGGRVVFGRADAPVVPLPDAVMASCAAPGFFPPVRLGGRRFVDGGAVSVTNADVALGCELDEVLVLAPMATYSRRRNRRSAVAQADLRLRAHVTRQLEVEAQRLTAAGTRVRIIAPTQDDLVVMGINLMNPKRRHEVLQTAMSSTREQLTRLEPLVNNSATGS